jgi:hypothetical protein
MIVSFFARHDTIKRFIACGAAITSGARLIGPGKLMMCENSMAGTGKQLGIP